MPLTRIAIAVVLALMPFFYGCSPDCVSLCEEADEEGCFGDGRIDCEGACEGFENMAEDEHCEDELDEYIACVDDSDDICDGFTDDCWGKAKDFEDCVEDYCADGAHESDCEDMDALD